MKHTPADATYGVGATLAIGLGAIIGGSAFATMGPAVQGAGGAAPLAYLLGSIPAWMTAYSYTRMAAAHPTCGGTMAYFNIAFGGSYISAALNLMLVVCYAAIASLYAGVFGSYAADIFHWHTPTAERIMSALGIVAVAIMNLSPAAWSKRVQAPLNACKFLVMGVFVAAALLSPLWRWENFASRNWQPGSSVIVTGLTIFMSYQGFELMAAIRKPFRSPGRTLPLAMILCLSIVTLYYCVLAYCTVGNVDYTTVSAESDYLLSAVATRFMGEAGTILMCAGAVIAATSALNADVFSVSAIPEQMAEGKEMPRYFLPTHAGARALGVIFLCGLLIIFVNILDLAELTAISSLGFLIIYTLANAISVKITPRTRKSSILSLLGAVICLGAACAVAAQLFTGAHGELLIGVTLGMLTLPFIWQAAYYLFRRRYRR